MTLYPLIGGTLIGVGAAILYYGFPKRPEPEPEPEEEEWATTNPLPPSDCSLCRGTRTLEGQSGDEYPCHWCWRGGEVAA